MRYVSARNEQPDPWLNEKLLLAAVIERAIDDLNRGIKFMWLSDVDLALEKTVRKLSFAIKRKWRDEAEDAYKWIMKRGDGNRFNSFVNLCSIVGLNSHAARRAIMANYPKPPKGVLR